MTWRELHDLICKMTDTIDLESDVCMLDNNEEIIKIHSLVMVADLDMCDVLQNQPILI